MSSVGDRLRQERVRRGLELDRIADLTRISLRHLAAIESDDLKSLPGEFFYRAFVRQYAQTLGLDEHEFDDEMPGALQPETEERFPIADVPPRRIEVPPLARVGPERRWSWSVSALVLVILICSALYAWWQRMRNMAAAPPPQNPVVEAKQPAPPQPAPGAMPQVPQPEAPATPPGGSQPPSPEPQAAPPTGAPPTSSPGSSPSQSQPAPQAQSPVAAPAPPGPTPATEGAQEIVLQVTASTDTWFRVRSGGKTLFANILKAGESKMLRAAGDAEFLVGNAGGIEITYNGKPVGEIGPLGQVRNVRITPEKVEITNPKKRQEDTKSPQEPDLQPLPY